MPHIALSFENNYGIYLFTFLLIPILFFYKTKIINFTNNNVLSLSQNTNNQLKGIFIIIVVLHHISQRMDPLGLMVAFHPIGYLAVGAFFFISGFGLTKSLKKNNKYLEGFLYKKIARIYLPFIIVNILTIITLYVYGITFTYEELIKYIIPLKLIDGTLWFIVTILIFYFFFYLSFKKSYSIKSLATITILILLYILVYRFLNKGEWTYISSLCFPLGIYYAFFEEKINSIIYNNFTLIISISLFLFLTTFILFKLLIFYYITKFISPVFFTIFIFVLFLKINPNTLIFNLIGTISLEIYLLHMKVLVLFSFFTELNSGIWIAFYLFTLILGALIFNKFNSLAYTKLASLLSHRTN